MGRSVAAAAILLALIPSAYLAWQSRDMPQLGYAHDDGMYWIAAKSLAEGSGYRIGSLPDAPYQTKYPPLFPLLLAGVWRAAPEFPGNLRLATLLTWLLAVVYVGASFMVLRGLGSGRKEAAALTAMVALSPWVALSSISLLSELPFSIAAFGALALIERARKAGAPWWLAVAAGGVGGAAYLTRSAGIVLLVVGPLALAGARRFKHAFLFAAAMLPAVAGWTLWTHWHRSGLTDPLTVYYTDYLGYYLRDFSVADLPLVVWQNLDSLASATGSLFVFGLGDSLGGKTVARLLAATAIAGVVRLGRRGGWKSYHLFAAAYALLLLFWDFASDQRFLIPVLPILVAGLWAELRNVLGVVGAAWRGGRLSRCAAAAAGVLLGAGLLAAAGRTVEAYGSALPRFVANQRATSAASLPVYRWMDANLPRDAKLLAYPDAVVYLRTGRRAYRFFVAPSVFYRVDRAALNAALGSATGLARSLGLSYAVVTPADPDIEIHGERSAAGERLVSASLGLRLLYRSGGGAVYRIE